MATYLVGTVHMDLKGPERLRKFLGFVRPSSICHEGPKEAIIMVSEKRRYGLETVLKGLNQPDPVLRLLALLEYAYGYEIWVPHHHLQEMEAKEITEDRDKPIEQKIREIAANDAEGTTVAICGAGHIFSEYHNLYERLKSPSVCRIRLPEVDKF